MIINSNINIQSKEGTAEIAPNYDYTTNDFLGWAHAGQYYACQCKDTSKNKVSILPSSQNNLDSFRVIVKFKHAAFANNEKKVLLSTNSTGVEIDIGKWEGNHVFFVSFGAHKSSGTSDWGWCEADIFSPNTFSANEFYYAVIIYNKSANKMKTAIYDKDGTMVAQTEKTVDFIPYCSSTTSETYLGGAASSSWAINGTIDISECCIERNGTLLWGKLTTKTQNMGLESGV